MDEIGMDISKNKPKLLTNEMFESVDIVVSMINKKWLPEYVKKSNKVRFWNVDDKYYKTYEGKVRTRNRIHTRVKRLLTELEKKNIL